MSGGTSVLGIEIPSTDPVFLGIVVGVHIPLGIACVIAGAVAMLARKGRGRHSSAGTTYFWSLAALFASVSVLSAMRWADNVHLFALGTAALACALLGRTALRMKWPNWGRLHITGMGASYVLLLIAFYVDNGKQLPVWKDLPPITYWLLPLALGLPVIAWALLRHPLRGLGEIR